MSKASADRLVKTIRRKTRQTYSAEEKIRMVSNAVLLHSQESYFFGDMCRNRDLHLREPVLQLIQGGP